MRLARSIAFAAAVFVLAASAVADAAGQDYPTRPVTIVNPFAPGGGVDQMARLIAGKLEQRLGKSFVIENKPGAGSIIAATYVQKSNPDGYTLLMAPAPTMAVNVSLYKSLPYEPLTDFVPLALLSGTPFVLMVNVDLPVKSVPELLAYAKANPDKMTFASAGPGVPHHLFMELFMSMTGMKASHVPYRGSLPALNDLVAGHIPMMFSDLGPATGLLEAERGASARHLDQDAASVVPRHPAARRGRRAGLRGGVLADASSRRPRRRGRSSTAQPRAHRRAGAAGGQGADAQVRIPAAAKPQRR